MARTSHGLYRPQESLPAGAVPSLVPFPRLARMRRTQTMFKCVRLASLRGFTAPTMLRSATGRREGSAGHTHDF